MLHGFIGKMVIISFSIDSNRSWFGENILAVFAFEATDFPNQQHFFVLKNPVQNLSGFAVVNGFGFSLALNAEKSVSRAPDLQANVGVSFHLIENQSFQIEAIYDIFFHIQRWLFAISNWFRAFYIVAEPSLLVMHHTNCCRTFVWVLQMLVW